MLIAVGNVDMNYLVDGIISMANDQNEKHEKNRDQKGNWKHDGGWGIAYIKDNEWIIKKSIKAIFEDPEIDQIRNIKTNLAIIHARKVTIGDISIDNTHPFQKKSFIFCHNGTIREKIHHNKEFEVKGNTDSEHLFSSILTENKKEKDINKAILKNLNNYKNYSGINIIMANQKRSYVFIKKNKSPNYYTMKMTKNKDLLIISSEILPQYNKLVWQNLKQEELITIDNKTLDTQKYKNDNSSS